MNSMNFSYLLIAVFAFTLTSCVAEKDFDNSAFEAKKPDAAPEQSHEHAEDVESGPVYLAKFETSKGDFTIEVHPDWSPRGAVQFKEAIEDGVYNEARFFRVLDGFMAQFGIAGDPKVSAKWRNKSIQDDPVKESNTRGMVSFAMAGPDTRTSQVFINFGNNAGSLDSQGFSPFGKVIEGMEVVDSLYAEYGEGAPRGRGPDQRRMQSEGNTYLAKEFPKLDYIKKVTITAAAVEEEVDAEDSKTAE